MHPADAADIIEHLSENDREKLIKLNNAITQIAGFTSIFPETILIAA